MLKGTGWIVGMVAVLLFAQSATAGTVPADIVFVIDESGSMGTVQANVRNNIGSFASLLSAGGIDARYALVGFGNLSVRPHRLTDFTDATGFASAATGLQAYGGSEPGYESIMAALNGGPTSSLGLTYRSGAVKNIILVTDEQSNYDLTGANWNTADALLTSENALLNGILTSFSANTYSNGGTYAGLVTAHGGTVFSLTTFNTTNQTVIDTFVQDFASRKIQEIQQQARLVPLPGTVALLGFGLAGLAVLRRRRR